MSHTPSALPDQIAGYGTVRPFVAADKPTSRPAKLQPSLRAAIIASGLADGGVISFHHHLRNGDRVLNAVLDVVADLGIRGVTVAASSLFPVHAPLVAHVRSGVVAGIHTAYMAGPVADAVSRGELATPAVLCTHGGRARAIANGDLRIDVAFLGAPAADRCGNLHGVAGPAACGTLGYAHADARHAACVVAVTDHLVPFPACPIDIAQEFVDYVVVVESIGDRDGILSGTTRPTSDPVGLRIAHDATAVIAASGLLVDGFSLQTGAGGISLAVADALQHVMHERQVQGSFASGGITGTLVGMLEAGLFTHLFDVQCFDLRAAASYRDHAGHLPMSAGSYAHPHRRGAVVDQLDVIVLGATEIDLDFNVNVTTGSDGVIMGGSGGHADAAAGARLALVTTRLTAGGYAKIVDRVTTITTPGASIDIVVTDAGVAVHPLRADLAQRLRDAGIALTSLAELKSLADGRATRVPVRTVGQRIVAVVEYRDGTVIDTVHQVL